MILDHTSSYFISLVPRLELRWTRLQIDLIRVTKFFAVVRAMFKFGDVSTRVHA